MSWGALFPGQGSQSVGMGKWLVENFPVARETFEEASDALRLNFKKLCFEGPAEDLQLTENTQPALLLVSMATFRVVASEVGVYIAAAAGHSIGEYAAIVSAGGLTFADGLRAVRIRGQAMQEAVPVGEGGMTAVMGLSDAQVAYLCRWAEEKSGISPVEAANFNAPEQVVISGSLKLLNWMKENAKAEIFAPETPRMKLIPLKVSAPFHCRLMKPAELKMREVLTEIPFRDTQWPIIQNFTAEATTDADILRQNLIHQVSGPVRWTQCVLALAASGVDRQIEFGSGKILSGLAKKIDSNGPTPFNINTLDELKILVAALGEESRGGRV